MSRNKSTQDFPTGSSQGRSSRKKPVSERRIQANRKNVLLSTGPKTARGKRTVSLNAIKHGLLAREVVITAGDGEESLEEFHALLGRLCECYEPIGVIEESLVQTIAACLWRKSRVIRAENGEIRKRLDTLDADLILQDSDKANLELALTRLDLGRFGSENQGDNRLSSMERWTAMQTAQCTLRSHDLGLAYLAVILQKVKGELTSDGHLSEETLGQVQSAFCFWDHLFAYACLRAGRPAPAREDQSPVAADNKESVDVIRSHTIALVDSRLKRLEGLIEHAQVREKLERDAEARSASLPNADATDKLLRYEAHLDRQLYRAMDQLERLQRQRRGESVPPPFNINLNNRRS